MYDIILVFLLIRSDENLEIQILKKRGKEKYISCWLFRFLIVEGKQDV